MLAFSRPLLLFAAFMQLASFTTAQLLNFASGELPSCAQGCTNLVNAQAACTPPEAAAATQQEYEVCFCQSAYLQNPPLKSSGAGVCPACTSSSDQQQMSNWYNNLCSTGQGAGTATTAGSTAAASPGATTTSAPQPSGPPSWWDQHGRWIAMVIVVVVVLIILIVVGLWWRRRYYRRRNIGENNTSSRMSWGPNVDPHSAYAVPYEKGNMGTQEAQVTTPMTPPAARQNSRGSKRSGKSKFSLRR